MTFRRQLAAFILFVTCFMPLLAKAAPVAVPGALSPGDQYRLGFIASAPVGGTDSTISFYNDHVAGIANSHTELAALATTWRAIVSTASIDARDNTETNPFNGAHGSVPIFLVNGTTKIADNNADLWDGSLDAAFNVSDTGFFVTPGVVDLWTGSNTDGTGFVGATLGTGSPVTGSADLLGSGWINETSVSNGSSRRLYALSGVLTVGGDVAVPEPGSAILLVSGVAVAVVMRRRTKPAGDRAVR